MDIKQHRLALGLSQAAFAAEMGVTASAVSAWERGVSLPSPGVAQRLERFLGIAPGAVRRSKRLGCNTVEPQPPTAFDGVEFARWRHAQGLTLRELEVLTGISRQTLSRWERGIPCRKSKDAITRLKTLMSKDS